MPVCSACGAEVGPDYKFCPNCGAALVPTIPNLGTTSPAEGGGETLPQPPKRWSGIMVAAIAIIILLIAASVFLTFPSLLPASTSDITTVANCPASAVGSTVVSAPNPDYDVQQAEIFTQTYTQLEFNVTALAQCDANGYGPAYLVNGLTNTGYWYQVGINWDWPLQSGGYSPGFGFVSEAWAPNGLTRSPPPLQFSGTVNPGDTIELSLSFSGDQVVASARDLNTSASGSMAYPSRGASEFLGLQAQKSSLRFSFVTQGYFTGLMTEWYHVSANYGGGSEESQVYSENTTSIGSATLAVGEWNFTGPISGEVFSDVANGGNPIGLGTQPTQLQTFVVGGYTLSADAYQFVTGP